MGGRGGASHRATAAGKGYTRQSYAPLVAQALKMGIRLDVGSFLRNNINPKYIEQTLTAVDAIYREFPAMRGYVKYIDGRLTSADAYASAGGDGGLHHGLYGRYSEEQMKASWDYATRIGFHPQGTKYNSIFVHEMGHQMEAYLNEKDYNDAWAWGKTANEVVLTAAQSLDRSIASLSDPKVKNFAKAISDYAVESSTTNVWATWETLAEAVQDVYDNGVNAKPLSKEIWKIMKEKLKK